MCETSSGASGYQFPQSLTQTFKSKKKKPKPPVKMVTFSIKVKIGSDRYS